MGQRLIVIGGGAAGFFCAVNAARLNPTLRVEIFEKSNKILSKVKVSGGGRCNVTHACYDINEMSKRYPRGQNFVKKTFHQFFTTDTIQWFEERGVKLKAEADGRMFPTTDSSQTIIDCLLAEAKKYRVEIKMNHEVKSLERNNGYWKLRLGEDREEIADFVCVASGGYPKSSMFEWIKNLGHTIEDPVPSLFTFNMPGHPITKLMGISVEQVKIKILQSKLSTEGPLLITHWGLSGPAVLKLSAWGARELKERNWEFGVIANWVPDLNEQTMRERLQSFRNSMGKNKVTGKNSFGLAQRLWEFLVEQSGINDETRWADLTGAQQNQLAKNLCACEFQIKGKTTFKEEFVTAGGVKLSEVDANTMMSKKLPSLFFAGEILDVDGITGGYNFQHAWTSGWVAAGNVGRLIG